MPKTPEELREDPKIRFFIELLEKLGENLGEITAEDLKLIKESFSERALDLTPEQLRSKVELLRREQSQKGPKSEDDDPDS